MRTMVSAQPHFLLFSGIERSGHRAGERWHFLLEGLDGETMIDAADVEPGVGGERLELLAVVRGLEALDQPSRVTLITASRQISNGLRYGLEEWRANNWCWERDGRWVPVKNVDLWRRIDRALRFHRVDCRRWRLDGQSEAVERNERGSAPAVSPRRPFLKRWRDQCHDWGQAMLRSLRHAEIGGGLVQA